MGLSMLPPLRIRYGRMQTSAHSPDPGAAEGNAQLVRRLGFWSTIGIVIGVTIGSGIFRTPATIATRVPDPMLMLGVWLAGGLISLCGALSVAELAGALPRTGGWYVYLKEAWGRLAGFLFGWSELVLIRASAAGAIATVFAEYLLRSIGVDPASRPGMTDYIAAVAIVVAAVTNVLGVQLGAIVAGASTVAKFGALGFLVIASMLLGGGTGASPANFTTGGAPVDAGLFGLALISVLWAYDGFADVSFASGEVKDPQRNLPRAIIIGTLAIIGIYLAANVAYLYVNPIGVVAASPLIAADTMQALFGPVGVAFVSVVVTVSTFGALIAIMLAAPRIFFAMAEDGLFFKAVARVHPRYHTPYVAISLAAVLGVLFVLTRTFEQLADTFVLSIWPFYGIAIAGLYKLRRTRPDLPRPYKVPLYPVLPAVFVAAVIYLVGNALIADPLWTGVTFAIVLAGVPVYISLFRSAARQVAAVSGDSSRPRS
ncbi:MAG: amino acid permease [Acidimicrobiia bacterium]|nr:amino acid permease [Acidimicrobiia bacterium]